MTEQLAQSVDPSQFAPEESTLGICQRFFIAELGCFAAQLAEEICGAHEAANAGAYPAAMDWNSLMFVHESLMILCDHKIPLPVRLQQVVARRDRWRAAVRTVLN
jgi:hypothetical protein